MNYRITFLLWIFAVFMAPGLLTAQDRRTIPLDLYLIIDVSEGFRENRNETIAWINEQIIDRLLQEGDRVVIWTAGTEARVIHTETIGNQKNDVKDKLNNLEISGAAANFSGAMNEAASRASRENPGGNRISYTLLVSSSAANLAPSIGGSSSGLFRWFRTERYSKWQVLVAAPNIVQRARQAASAFMSGY